MMRGASNTPSLTRPYRIVRLRTVALVFALALALAATSLFSLHASAGAVPKALDWPLIQLTPLTSGVIQPVYVTHAGDGSGRIFIVERAGRIRIYANGTLAATPFLSITDRVESGYIERGLLSVAFPPNYAARQHFYVYYTKPDGALVIARFGLTGNPNVANAASEHVILKIDHPTNLNHNGGQLQFGPADGYLYLATGDGGSGGDPPNNAQTPSVVLGKMLRLDVETGNPLTYTVPPSNPYTQTAGYRPEIWALGLRNPWRFSFDRLTHDIYIGDVGQQDVEEIDRQPASSPGGENYGWHILEGNSCYSPPSGCSPPPRYAAPIFEYSHAAGDCAVVGGYVYRGSRFMIPRGVYFHADECTGRIRGLQFNGSTWENKPLFDAPFNVSSFGEDEQANLYVADLYGGTIYQVISVEKKTFLPLLVR
jgi:glucose/arabinose dehydrogenase